VIVATGASSGLLAQMGLLHRQPRVGLAVRAYFEGVTGLVPNQIQFRFDGVPLPGYAWIFPTSATAANIGLGLFAAHSHWRSAAARPAPRAVFERWLQGADVRQTLGQARLAGPIKGYPIRSDFLESPTYGERVLLVGEAAGLVNPLTGDGIDFALETGRLAAEHLAGQFASGDFSARGLAAYDRQLRRRYAAFFRVCLGLRYFVLGNPRLLNRLVRAIPHHRRLQRRLIAVLLGYSLGQRAPGGA
jgi:menaquinone-9 beta-reductase